MGAGCSMDDGFDGFSGRQTITLGRANVGTANTTAAIPGQSPVKPIPTALAHLAAQQATACGVPVLVQALSQTGHWAHAQVVGRQEGPTPMVMVQWAGCGPEQNEWVSAQFGQPGSRLRFTNLQLTAANGAIRPATAHARSGGLLLLHFVGFAFDHDEWLPEASPRIHWGNVGGIPAFGAAAGAGGGAGGSAAATSWGAGMATGAEVVALAEPVGQAPMGQVVGVVATNAPAQGQVVGALGIVPQQQRGTVVVSHQRSSHWFDEGRPMGVNEA